MGLVPARAGSEGIPGKNLAPVAGKSLLQWTVEVARAASTISRTVVSTDGAAIATHAHELGAEVLERPSELAASDVPMIDVVVHALGEIGPCDALVLLQPTSPLRRPEHIDGAVELLKTSGADCVVSVVEVPHRFAPDSLMTLEDGRLVALGNSAGVRQRKPTVYARNGPAVLALRPERLGGDLYGGDCRPFVMTPRDSIDVDDPFDLELADLLLRQT